MTRTSHPLVTHKLAPLSVTLGALAFLTACSSSTNSGTNDAGGTTDAPATNDVAAPDSAAQDSAATDSGTPDSTVTDSGSNDSNANANDTAPPTDTGAPVDTGSPEAGGDAGGFCATSTNVAMGKTMVALACGQSTPSNVVVRNGVVYWTNNVAGGTVMSVPETGGTPTVVASNQDFPWAIAVDDNNVYWTNYDGAGAAPNGAASNLGTVWKQGLSAGGTPVMMDSALAGPWGIAVDTNNIYFTTFTGGKIKSVPIAGGADTTLATLAVGPKASPLGIAVDATNVYFETDSGGVYSIAKTAVNGTPTTLVPYADVTGGYGVAINASTVFFADEGQGGNVYSVPIAGAPAPTVLASGQATPSLLAVNGTTVYFTNYATNSGGCSPACGSVSSVPIGGGAVTVLANLLDYPEGIAVDPMGVYFAAASGGRVWRLSPP